MSVHGCIEFIKQVGEKGLNARLAEHFISIRNEFNQFNNIGAQMLDSVYRFTFKLLKNGIFGVKASKFRIFYATLNWT